VSRPRAWDTRDDIHRQHLEEQRLMVRNPAKLAARARWYRAHGNPVEADRIEKMLTSAHLCRRCGRELTDPASIEAGIGPDCATLEAAR
jgi:hypothetical protein